MTPTQSVDLKSVKNLQDLFFAKFVLRSVGKQKNVTIATSYFARDASKIGFN